jgi:hypothetical protein
MSWKVILKEKKKEDGIPFSYGWGDEDKFRECVKCGQVKHNAEFAINTDVHRRPSPWTHSTKCKVCAIDEEKEEMK